MNRNMTHDMKKDTILNYMIRRLIRNGRTRVRLGAHFSSLKGVLRTMLLLLLLMTAGASTAWGQNYKYIFVNNKGKKAFNYSTNNTTIDKTTLAIHPKAKSVLATNFRFYTTEAAAVADANGTIGTAGTDYYVEGTTISGITGVINNTFYVRYDLVASPSININGGKWYKLQIHGRNGTLYYIYYDSSDKTLRINNTDDGTGTEKYLWRFESGDPYDVYITNLLGLSDLSNGVVSTTGAEIGTSNANKGKLVNYQPKIADNDYNQSTTSMTSLQSFIIVQNAYLVSSTWSSGMYQIVGAYNGIEYKPYDDNTGKSAYEANMPYYICRNNSSPSNGNQLDFARSWRAEDTAADSNPSLIKFIEVSKDYTFHIINNSDVEAVKATVALSAFGEAITASMMPDIIKSPLASDYKFYPTEADAIAGTNELSSLSYSLTDIYVRYTTASSSLNINGGQDYYITTAGTFLYASSTTALGVEDEITAFDNTRKWKLNGNDAYQLTIQNADNSQYVTYDVSSGEAVPTLSASGSKFFLHEGADGKYEVVAVTTADYSSNYYTLGVANNTLKLYSNSNYPLGEGEVQTSIHTQVPCAQPTISLNSNTGEVTISSSTSGASIYYTTDGNTPTVNPANLYSSLTITGTTTIMAIAVKDGYINSSVATQTFNQVETPVIQKEGTKSIVITCATAGATIHYTVGSTAPDADSPTYSAPLSEGVSNKLIQVLAIKEGMVPATASNTILLQCDKPIIIKGNKKFTITCDYPSGVDVYYTIDGSTPSSSKTKYTGEVLFETYNFTVKAIAVATDYDDSEVAEKEILEGLDGGGTAESPYLINSTHDFSLFVDMANEPGGTSACFKLMVNIGAGDKITEPFSGTFESGTDANGNFYKISGLTHALFNTINNGTVKNVILKDINIQSGDSDGDAGAICNKATGNSRIYNCGVLGTLTETKDAYGNVTNIESTSSISGSGYVGSIVGLLDGTSRVINCYSYANVSGGTMAAGIVGNNAQASTQSSLKTIVVNCMFYGDISGDGSKYPVYGNNSINNDSDTGINPYCYFRKNATFTPTDYNRSWPAEEKNLTRFEYYRSVLNSNRKLCTWWVNGTNGTAPTDNDVTDVGIAKWVLDPSIAPYPILKEWGKYPSVINQDSDKRVDPSTKTWEKRDNASANWGKDMAPETEGQILGSVSVTINGGTYHSGTKHPTGSTSKFINITAMDTEYNDYCYGKIQLPYYNEIFGNPDGNTWDVKYGGNYSDYVVTGWDISGGSNAEDYNFADRDSYKGRVYAQGGYFYVPKGVTSISITAHWGKAVYLSNRGYSIDRVKVTKAAYKEDKAFAPAGTISNNFQGYDVYDDLQNAIKALGTNTDYPTVYDQAIVLIGNHQVKNGSNDVGYNLDSKWHPFTFMSADLDFDNEPDNCLELQFRNDIDRPGIQPIRFDFLPVIELGLALRHDNLAYAIGIMVPQGHFEVTETAFMRTTQFEYDGFRSYTDKRIEDKSPVIINGGEYEMFTVRYHNSNRTSYFLLGGNAWIHRFAPGAHPNMGNSPQIYLCPINVIGGEVKELYLTGLYRPELAAPANQGAPRCYTDGGKFDIIAGAGYDKVAAGSNVTFIINHSKITEFYGGGINGSNAISGNIDVTIDNSSVDKYCGGPKVGDMTGKTVTTHATGTTFGVFYGGGNGGNSYYRQLQRDGDQPSSNIGNWNYDPQNYTYHWDDFTPLGVKDDDVNDENKGYHAEYEFEVFNQSNGVKDQITQRGFIKWIQFGITKTGNVSNTLSNCKILNNFYGGGNLATVDGDVTSTLTNTTVNGCVFGAGYSAAIPTFQVHDKSTAVFPSITAGVITDGHIDYDSKVYEWTNDLNGKTEDERKADPTYSKVVDGKTKWYCYTWNPLVNLGAVTGTATLNINGTTTVVESVYGGGEESNVSGNTNVNICAVQNGTGYSPEAGSPVISGNVFGGGKGLADSFTCSKAMVGIDGDGVNDPDNGGTSVTIGNGMVKGSVYGGGEVGRVEKNTVVTIGLESGQSASAPVIKGNVFGAGAGLNTHGYSALVRGTSTVTVQGDAKVERSVYGGGEKASVGRYIVGDDGLPQVLNNSQTPYSGYCYVTIRGNAEIGTDDMLMKNTTTGKPDDWGHVFGGGKGVLPYEPFEDYADGEKQPYHMDGTKHLENGVWDNKTWDDNPRNYPAYSSNAELDADYIKFIKSLALATQTEVTIGGNAFVKGSVYGGSENGFVQKNTHVTITGGQIGNGEGVNRRYTTGEWNSESLKECAHWPFVSPYAPYDMYANESGYDAKGGAVYATDGHTYYGNVFGGGSGVIPYAPGKWFEWAGAVYGNTQVDITGGHILTSVYGGNEQTDVGTYTKSGNTITNVENGKCTINMVGGTVGVPRTEAEMKAHAVTCYIFGAGKGDPRTMFNTWTNVRETEVNISGTARIYGSTFGGGEDGHVIEDVETNIGGTVTIGENSYPHTGVIIGTTGTSGADGNIFGGGRGFSATALTAGVVCGDVTVNIEGGKMLGSVFGGGRLASVGTYLVPANDPLYGTLIPDKKNIDGTDNNDATHGHIIVNISGGTIGATDDDGLVYSTSSIGEVFGGSKGSATSPLPFGLTRNTTVTISEADADTNPTVINNSVYGGGEAGNVVEDVSVSIEGGTIKCDVYGGGALAHTNTGNWDAKATQGDWSAQKDPGNWTDAQKTSSLYTTVVSLKGGKVRDVYGGALGDAETPAYVYGDTKVDLNGISTKSATPDAEGNDVYTGEVYKDNDNYIKGCIVERIFGCNNVNGTPKGKSLVYVHATQRTGMDNVDKTNTAVNDDPAAEDAVYDVKAVYGGGNMAAYEPVLATATSETEQQKASTNVIIDGCHLTSIKHVYGGGNAASTPATKVTVNGTHEIFELFGGGNGFDPISYDGGATKLENPGANVGFYDYSEVENTYNTKEKRTTAEGAETFISKYVYGSGVATLNVFGGQVHRVFGGSNTKGNVRKTALTLLEEGTGCDFCVDEAYGGGKSAQMDAEAILHMACIPGLKVAYGGAQEADIQSDVTLNITNGRFNRVFGGNNLSGRIRGSITVNIEETGCRPIIIGELYGGGNQAGYSKYGYKEKMVTVTGEDGQDKQIKKWVPLGEDPNDELPKDDDGKPKQLYNDPVVNIKSFTSIGEVYGGGLGETATMVGSPHVNINVALGEKADHEDANIGEDAKTYNTAEGLPIPSHSLGAIGAINNVYGGGNAAKVIGDTYVSIGREKYVEVTTNIKVDETDVSNYYVLDNGNYSQASGKAESGKTYYMLVKGADIRENVYGGGNAAEVTGNTNVVIGKKEGE